MLKRFLVGVLAAVIALALWCPVAGAQSSEPFNPFSAFKASAETWAMSKYGDAKPSLYTGAMHYSVPVYTYQDPDFTLPVSLEYNFDGYRPSQHSGTVGLGWNLSCGGVITRDIRGYPDDDAVSDGGTGGGSGYVGYYRTAHDGYGYMSDSLNLLLFNSVYCNTGSGNPPTLAAAQKINFFSHIPVFIETTAPGGLYRPSGNVQFDLTPDIYHFVIPGHSGDFMFMPDGSIRVFNSDLPYGEVKVEFAPYGAGTRTFNSAYWCTFSITLGDGTKYEFGRRNEAIDYSSSKSSPHGSTLPSVSATAFHLDRIIAPNGRTMEFRYSSAKQVSVSGSISYTPDYRGGNYTNPSEVVKTKSFSYFSVPETVLVDNKTVVSFVYQAKTQDECASDYFDEPVPSAYPISVSGVTNASPMRLSSITVTNRDGDVVDRADLTQTFASSGTPKMFLDAVSTLRGGRHAFSYERNRTFPKNDRQETDHWGFWNGRYLTDLRNIVTFSPQRYSQMTDVQKEPDVWYARAGAMTQITYPTGGTTDIEYEGHVAQHGLDEGGEIFPSVDTVTINVGGVRVGRMINRTDENAPGDTTSFFYDKGFLYHMPRYLFSAPMNYYSGHPAPNNFILYTTVTGYNADCDYAVSRDEVIGYGKSVTVYPDGSRTETEYSSYEYDTVDDYYNELYQLPYLYRSKVNILYNTDYFDSPYDPTMGPYIVKPVIDRRNLRGRVVRETTKDALGANVREVRSEYSTYSVHLNHTWWNDLDHFNCAPWTCESPLLARETVTDYADDGSSLRTVRLLSYNAAGQVGREDTFSPDVPGDTLRTCYTYYHESGEPESASALPGALRTAMRSRKTGSRTDTLCIETRGYEDASEHIQPDTIRRDYGGMIEDTFFSLDALFRITRADLPGGAWVEYDWDGNDIVRVRQNDGGNETRYNWKPLVGVTEITAPSGQTEGADYDNKNRLWKRRDTAGRVTESYQYKLKKE